MSRSPQYLRRMVTTYAILFVSLLVLSGGVALAMVDRRVSAVVILSTLGVNLMASALFGLIFALIAGRLQDATLQQNFEENAAQTAAAVVSEIAKVNTMFLPAATYPAINPTKDDFGARYNTDVTTCLQGSSICHFRGTSAWFVGTRLRQATNKPQAVRIAILDPGDERALNRRAADRAANKAASGVTADESRSLLLEEILMAIVALFDQRKSVPMDVVYDDDSSVYRYEIYDDALYLSWFHGPQSTERELPQSYRFSPGSFVYKTLAMDFLRRFESAHNRVRFDSSVGEEFLSAHLRDLTGGDFPPDRIEELRKGYAEQIADFAGFLRNTRILTN